MLPGEPLIDHNDDGAELLGHVYRSRVAAVAVRRVVVEGPVVVIEFDDDYAVAVVAGAARSTEDEEQNGDAESRRHEFRAWLPSSAAGHHGDDYPKNPGRRRHFPCVVDVVVGDDHDVQALRLHRTPSPVDRWQALGLDQ